MKEIDGKYRRTAISSQVSLAGVQWAQILTLSNVLVKFWIRTGSIIGYFQPNDPHPLTGCRNRNGYPSARRDRQMLLL